MKKVEVKGKWKHTKTLLQKKSKNMSEKRSFTNFQQTKFCKFIGKSDIEDIDVLCELISKIHKNKGKESTLLLNVVKREKATLEECIKILSTFEQCPICQRTCELFKEEKDLPERDFEHENETLKKEIETLKKKTKETKTYFPPVTEKPSDFESNICEAAKEGKLTSVQYLVEQCHANVETKSNNGRTPINYASLNGHLEVVKYLYETCHAKITNKTIEKAKTEEIKEYLRSKQ